MVLQQVNNLFITQRDNGVPSSANWKPTNPLMSKQQYAAATNPVYTAANHFEIVNFMSIKKIMIGWNVPDR